ncbi:hypothetical protein MTR67_001788 [Solanum verrucosum]|uniref:Uncharacterized protein n=1 Tax=Solanum verrucosum TaxID=315347 RepID=A0AAF0PP74_SOLVR|nr:hypothetical protein MTR67_001788 [Solanum verrucosum]
MISSSSYFGFVGYSSSNMYQVWTCGGCRFCLTCLCSDGHMLPNCLPHREGNHCTSEILDCVLGHHEVLFRRAQLKALVSIHSQETAEEAMTPIESTFSLNVNSKLDCYVAGGNPHVTTHHLMAKGEKTESVVVDIEKATVLAVTPPTSADAVTNGVPE